MPPFVGLFVEGRGKPPVRFGRDDRCDIPFIESCAQPVGIERAVGEQVVGRELVDQFRHGAQIVGLPGRQPEIDEIAECVGQRQYFGGDAAARAAYGLALSPPLAPWPERWSLTMEPSIIAYSKSASEANALNIL